MDFFFTWLCTFIFQKVKLKVDRCCAHVGLRLTKPFAVSVFLSRYTLSWRPWIELVLPTLAFSTPVSEQQVFHDLTPVGRVASVTWFGLASLFFLFVLFFNQLGDIFSRRSSLGERHRRLLLSRDGGYLSTRRGIFSCSRWLLSGLSAFGHGDGPGLLPSDAVSVFRG